MNLSTLTVGIFAALTPAFVWASSQGDPTRFPISVFGADCVMHHETYVVMVDGKPVTMETEWYTVTCPNKPVGVNG